MLVGRLNRLMAGWANYFILGQVSPAYAAVDRHATRRLRPWLCRKHKVATGNHAILGRASLARLWAHSPCTAHDRLSVGEGMISSESRMRAIRTSGSMSGVWKRGRVRLTDRPSLHYRATSRLYPHFGSPLRTTPPAPSAWRLNGYLLSTDVRQFQAEEEDHGDSHLFSPVRFTSRTMGSGRSGPAPGWVMIAQLIGTESPAVARASRVDASGTT